MSVDDLLTRILRRLDAVSTADFGLDDIPGSSKADVEALVACGLLTPSGRVFTVRCALCDEHHASAVEYLEAPDGAEPVPYYECPTFGRDWLSPDQLQKWTATRAGLCGLIGRTEGITPASRVIGGCLYEVGSVRLNSIRRSVFVAFGTLLPSQRDRFLALDVQEATRGALVLTVGQAAHGLFPTAAAATPLQESITLSGVGASVDLISIAMQAARMPVVAAQPELNGSAGHFQYRDDFTMVILRDQTFEPTALQAIVIGRLWKAYQMGDPCRTQDELLKGVSESYDPRLKNVFRSLPNWSQLIVQCTRRGKYRLNVD